MLIKDINEVLESLGKITNLEVLSNGIIKLYFHKNSTLELIPSINMETNEISYVIDFLSGKQNKEIDKLLSKKLEIEEKIQSIKNSNEKEEKHFIVEEDIFEDFE